MVERRNPTLEPKIIRSADEQRRLDRLLLAAIEAEQVDQIDALLVQKANINQHEGLPLRIMAARGNLGWIRLLIEKGADLHLEDEMALREAAKYGHMPAVRFLVSQGAKVQAAQNGALRWAEEAGHTRVCDFLRNKSLHPVEKK